MIGVDLGSNTIRFIEYSQGNFKDEYEEVVRTAENMYKTSTISQDAVSRIIKAINEAKKRMDFQQEIIAVATAAFRNAKNQQEVKREIFKATGVNFTVISSFLEAKLTTLAVKEESSKFFDKNIVMTDIGGASTEIAFWGKEKFFYKSFDLGIVVCSEKYRKSEQLYQYIQSFQNQFQEFLQEIQEEEFILTSTSGTPTTLAALKHGLNYKNYDKTKVSGTTLTSQEIQDLQKSIVIKPHKEISSLVGAGREELIVTGVTIFLEIIRFFNKTKTYVFDNSLREGIIYGKIKGLL